MERGIHGQTVLCQNFCLVWLKETFGKGHHRLRRKSASDFDSSYLLEIWGFYHFFGMAKQFCIDAKRERVSPQWLSQGSFSLCEDQRERDLALGQFKSGSTRTLVATDVAARGLDIKASRTNSFWWVGLVDNGAADEVDA